MKPTKPVLSAKYVPSWKQSDGYLKRKFDKIIREQAASDAKKAPVTDFLARKAKGK